jgi:hypothetical protein
MRGANMMYTLSHPYARYLDVYLDGVKVSCVLVADDVEGYIVAYEIEEVTSIVNGKPIKSYRSLNTTTGERGLTPCATRRMGKVEVKLHDDAPEGAKL